MSSVLETGGRGLVGNRVLLWLLAAGRQLHTMVGSLTRVAEKRAIQEDAVAGSEFVDDRIRELE
jgi:nucleoside-diphosphate-sugar epimerase